MPGISNPPPLRMQAPEVVRQHFEVNAPGVVTRCRLSWLCCGGAKGSSPVRGALSTLELGQRTDCLPVHGVLRSIEACAQALSDMSAELAIYGVDGTATLLGDDTHLPRPRTSGPRAGKPDYGTVLQDGSHATGRIQPDTAASDASSKRSARGRQRATPFPISCSNITWAPASSLTAGDRMIARMLNLGKACDRFRDTAVLTPAQARWIRRPAINRRQAPFDFPRRPRLPIKEFARSPATPQKRGNAGKLGRPSSGASVKITRKSCEKSRPTRGSSGPVAGVHAVDCDSARSLRQ